MTVMLLRTSVRPEAAADTRAAVHKLFAALHEAKPQGVKYASYVAPDQVTYTVLLEIADGVENPLPAIPAFAEFQKSLGGWLAAPPEPEQLTLAGEYRG